MELRLGKWHLSLTLVFLLLGFLLATGFSTQQRLAERPGLRKKSLIEFIRKQRQSRKRLEAQLLDVRKKLDGIESDRGESEGVLALYGRQLDQLRLKAGLSPVIGPGIEVLVGDAKLPPQDADPDNFIVHDYDLQIIVNALWRGGAENIAINNERLVPSTGIRSAGTTILINSRPKGGPFRISAIGDPKSLEKGLRTDSDAGLLLGDYAQQYGLHLEVTKRKKLKLPGYTGSLTVTSEDQ